MPNAATHILIPIIIMDLIRDYKLKDKKIITTNHLLLCGIGGILPDIDVAFGLLMTMINGASPWIFHRTITHTLFIPLLLLVIATTYNYFNKEKTSKIFLMISFGYLMHIILDFLLIETIMPFYPISTAKIGLNIISGNDIGITLMMALDTVILLVWLIHEQIKHRISDYI